MAWTTSFPEKYSETEAIILEAKKRLRVCEEWEAQTRVWYDLDTKFANGDSRNMFQWDQWVIGDRLTSNRPCLTINKTRQHNLLIVNDAKQNKPGVNIRPVGDDASFEAAQVFQEVVRHIEYVSNAENVYDNASVTQVEGGIGYWRVCTDYISARSFDQEIYIKRIKDPRSVYLDIDINEVDGSDARYGFIFEDMAKDLYDATYPDYADVSGSTLFQTNQDGWLTRDTVRVAEYYRKTQKKETFCSFIDPRDGSQVEEFVSKLTPDQKEIYKFLKEAEDETLRERKVLTDNIEWFKIAGNEIIDRGPWLGKYVPIVRLVGSETIIDGVLDRKGHTRALLDAQRIYNINTSANVEYGALQTKAPWVGPMAAFEGLEEYWATANTVNHSWLPFNHMDEDGKPIPAPSRPAAPQSSPGYVQQMQIAQNEMMMVSGQYQAQMGENENAKSGVAINARQRQGDRATYHFIDNLAIAVRFTGKILIDLIPKIYDTPRVMRISASDGSIKNVTIDVNAPQALEQANADGDDKDREMIQLIFNPSVGIYDVQSDTGPSFATRRQEAFNALTQIAASNKDFMHIAGDLLWKVADFPEAQALAERYRKIIPANITGDAPDPQTAQIMEQASQHIEQLQKELGDLTQKYQDRTREFDIKEGQLSLNASDTMLDNLRKDYEAINKRITSLGNSGPAISMEQIQPLIDQAVRNALAVGGPGADMPDEMAAIGQGGTPVPSGDAQGQPQPSPDASAPSPDGQGAQDDQPPMEGARKAGDGNWYVQNPDGGYSMVSENA